MDLEEIRVAFVNRSGREDLINDDDSDNGADFYINAGQKLLDRMDIIPKSMAKVYETVSSGDWYKIFQHCRAVKQVYVASDEDRWALEKKDLGWMLLEYPEPIADLDTGNPLYYSPAILRVVPEESDVITMSKFVGETVQIADTEHYTYNGILFMPPADDDFILEIHGLFYTHELSGDDDESFWSVAYPEILLMAAMYELEVMYRNTEGARDWMAAIRNEVMGLGMDMVEEDIADVDQMEG